MKIDVYEHQQQMISCSHSTSDSKYLWWPSS